MQLECDPAVLFRLSFNTFLIFDNFTANMGSLLNDFELQYAAITGELTQKLGRLRHQIGSVFVYTWPS